jgi:VanZ family protein
MKMMTMRTFKLKSSIWLYLIIFLTLIIWTNSMLSAEVSSEQSGFITDLAQSILGIINIDIATNTLSSFIRTFAHFTEFFILGIFWGYYLKQLDQSIILVFIFVFFSALIDESIQLFSDGRAFQVFDILVDMLGGTFAYVFHKAIDTNIMKINQKKK